MYVAFWEILGNKTIQNINSFQLVYRFPPVDWINKRLSLPDLLELIELLRIDKVYLLWYLSLYNDAVFVQSHFRFFFLFLSFFPLEFVCSSLLKLSDSMADIVFASISMSSSIFVATFSS